MAKALVQVAIPHVSLVTVAPLPRVAAIGDAPMMLAFCIIFSCRIRSKEHPRENSFKTTLNREIVCKRTSFGAICLLVSITQFELALYS